MNTDAKAIQIKNKSRTKLNFRSKQPRKSTKVELYSISNFQVHSMEVRTYTNTLTNAVMVPSRRGGNT